MEDKDYKSALKVILRHTDNIIFTKPQYYRSLDPAVLMNLAVKTHTNEFLNFFLANDMKEAVKIAVSLSIKPRRVLVIGSFFLVSDAVKAFRFQKYFN